MLVQGDAKALEWLGAVYLSKDKVGYEEINGSVDQHTENQRRFGLPSRLIAKTFVFRLIYGGSAYSYANDSDFAEVSTSERFWQKVIDEFYDKYKGVKLWHDQLMQTVTRTGKLVMPTGRQYKYTLDERGNWPRTTILNYPVQGLGADLMAIARVSYAKRFKSLDIKGKLISTVHDSIVVDVPEYEVERTCQLFYDVFDTIPANFQRLFGTEFDLPMKVEVEVGKNLKEMTGVD